MAFPTPEDLPRIAGEKLLEELQRHISSQWAERGQGRAYMTMISNEWLREPARAVLKEVVNILKDAKWLVEFRFDADDEYRFRIIWGRVGDKFFDQEIVDQVEPPVYPNGKQEDESQTDELDSLEINQNDLLLIYNLRKTPIQLPSGIQQEDVQNIVNELKAQTEEYNSWILNYEQSSFGGTIWMFGPPGVYF